MREIKFRFWDNENKKIIKGVPALTIDSSDGAIYNVNNGDYLDWIVMQFTGLKDKNGKEIYESDLIKNQSKTKTIITTGKKVFSPSWEIRKIVFSEGKFGGVILAENNSYWGDIPSKPNDLFSVQEYWEIIGNIYETPELVK